MIPGDTSSFFPVESLFQSIDDTRPPAAATTTPSSIPYLPHDFHGVASGMMMRRSMSFSGVDIDLSDHQDQDDDMSEDGGALGEKKKRLTMEQVKALEKSFELGSKLEPERKMRLAKALGLLPKQVAIWFQNRRARGKTKQMEKEYEHLKKQLELLKADNELLRAQNEQYHSELMALQSRESSGLQGPINLNKENEASWSTASESSADVNLGMNPPGPGTTSMESGLNPNSGQVLQAAGNGHHHAFSSGMEQPGPAVSHFLRGSNMGRGIHHNHEATSDGGLSNMFSGVHPEQQPSYWPWPEHPNFR